MTSSEAVSASILSVLGLSDAYIVSSYSMSGFVVFMLCVTSCLACHLEIESCGKNSSAYALDYYDA